MRLIVGLSLSKFCTLHQIAHLIRIFWAHKDLTVL